ncbi:MAG: hypothetical protein HYZ58_05290, partial [Acidobacteria bacterium]|nr:hypothetical protein [Acidobacteriota bacterium]
KILSFAAIILSLAIGTAGAQARGPQRASSSALGWEDKPQTLKGHLIDVSCGTEKDSSSKTAAKHDKPCLEMDDCVKSGYGVMTADNKFYKFDAAGNQNARKLIKATDKGADWRVTVVGTVAADTITVQSLALDK